MKQPYRHRPKAVAVQTVSVMVALDPEVAVGNADVAVLVAQSSDEVSLQADDTLDDLLLRILGRQDGDDVAALDLVVPHAPAVQQHDITSCHALWVEEGLHGRALHPCHACQPVQDGDRDGDGHEKAADKGPQVAPPRPGLLSHRG